MNLLEVAVAGRELLAIEITSDSGNKDGNVKVTSINLKTDKVQYLKGSDQYKLNSNKIDVYLAEKDKDDDIDANNASKAYDVDINGNVWAVANGSIYKFENNKFNKVYTDDSSINSLNVYDDNNLIAWKKDGDIFTTVNGTTNENQGSTTKTGTGTTNEKAPVVKAGWVQVADKSWSYNKTDGTKAIGWLNDNGTWYYLNASGAMLANTTVAGYKLGANGAWIR